MRKNKEMKDYGKNCYIAGIDIGNSTTEVALVKLEKEGPVKWWNACVETTGVKGTKENVKGLLKALTEAAADAAIEVKDVSQALINEATPVIGDLAMSTISETIITDSAMIGHNPSTPGGRGLGIGRTIRIENVSEHEGGGLIVIVPGSVGFQEAAKIINEAADEGISIEGVIAQKDDGVLISNRLNTKIPIVDEVKNIEAVPVGMPAAVEVAEAGRTISELCNPYGIASIFNLDSDETKSVANIAVTLIGNRSAVVIKTPTGAIREYHVPIGYLTVKSGKSERTVDISSGAKKIMNVIDGMKEVTDITGEACTSVGGMLGRIKQDLSESSGQPYDDIKVRDVLAVDTVASRRVKGAIAGETCVNKAIGLAAMVYTDHMLMDELMRALKKELPFPVSIGGVEVEMAVRGTLTTPGTKQPLVVVDMGAGSVDAAYCENGGEIKGVHLAGAGEMVTRMINSELNLNDRDVAEIVKRYPAVHVNSLFYFTTEEGQIFFPEKPCPLPTLGKTALLMENGVLYPLDRKINLDRISKVRRDCKAKVLLTNVERALKKIAPGGNIRVFDHVVLIGGCALDFEISEMISEHMLSEYGVVCGAGNIRGKLGPRCAVATGLVKDFLEKKGEK